MKKLTAMLTVAGVLIVPATGHALDDYPGWHPRRVPLPRFASCKPPKQATCTDSSQPFNGPNEVRTCLVETDVTVQQINEFLHCLLDLSQPRQLNEAERQEAGDLIEIADQIRMLTLNGLVSRAQKAGIKIEEPSNLQSLTGGEPGHQQSLPGQTKGKP
jgi:hypothetical protein